MFKKSLMLGLIVPTLALFGCGDDNELSEADAQKAFAASTGALMDGQGNAACPTCLTADQGSFTYDYTYTCNQGGTLDLSGSGSGTGTAIEFQLSNSFNACQEQGITIDGDVDWNLEVTGEAQSAQFVYTYEGELTFSGEINGSCAMDFTMTGSISSTSFSYTFSGTICGYDASGTLSYSGGL